jgi:hypothetical protein
MLLETAALLKSFYGPFNAQVAAMLGHAGSLWPAAA